MDSLRFVLLCHIQHKHTSAATKNAIIEFIFYKSSNSQECNSSSVSCSAVLCLRVKTGDGQNKINTIRDEIKEIIAKSRQTG